MTTPAADSNGLLGHLASQVGANPVVGGLAANPVAAVNPVAAASPAVVVNLAVVVNPVAADYPVVVANPVVVVSIRNPSGTTGLMHRVTLPAATTADLSFGATVSTTVATLRAAYVANGRWF